MPQKEVSMQIIVNNLSHSSMVINSGFNVIDNMSVSVDGGVMIGGGSGIEGGDVGMEVPSGSGESVLSSWGFVGGITGATLVVSIVLGILLAKVRIKKGFDLYED